MAIENEVVVTIRADASQAMAELARLSDLLESVPQFEVQELEELTWSWPWWMLFICSIGGGLTVLLFFFIVGTVMS